MREDQGPAQGLHRDLQARRREFTGLLGHSQAQPGSSLASWPPPWALLGTGREFAIFLALPLETQAGSSMWGEVSGENSSVRRVEVLLNALFSLILWEFAGIY